MKFQASKMPPRILICGEPASGKTGALAMLANAGHRLFIHDFDQNTRVIGNYLKPGHADIYVQSYHAAKIGLADIAAGTLKSEEARKRAVEKAIEENSILANGELRRFVEMLEHWKEPDFDAGPSKDLTPNDVIVIDSGTFLGDMILLAVHQDPRVKRDLRSLYNVAGDYYTSILNYLTSDKIGASVIVLTHIRQTGQKDENGNIISGLRLIPTAIGDAASKKMPTYFSDIWHLEVDRAGNRSYKTSATDKMALRTSAAAQIKNTEPFDLASMFKRLLT